MNGVGEATLEVCDGCEAAAQDASVDFSEIIFSFGKLVGADGYKRCGVNRRIDFGQQEGCFSNVEGEKRLNTVRDEVWGMTCGLSSGNTVGPEDVGRENWPLRDVAVASLYERVANGPVRALDDAIRLRIVCRDVDVADMIFFCEPVESGDKWCAIVRDDLLESSPSAQYLFKDERAKRSRGFCP